MNSLTFDMDNRLDMERFVKLLAELQNKAVMYRVSRTEEHNVTITIMGGR